jgi:adenosylcobinamide amidohydrolase
VAVIEGVEVTIDREAVVVAAREPLTILSSAFVRGGFTTARAIVNLHVRKNIPEAETDGILPRFTERRGIQDPGSAFSRRRGRRKRRSPRSPRPG